MIHDVVRRMNSTAINASPSIQAVLRSSGQPLDAQTRAFMEPRFDFDFSQVRVHANAKAAMSARVVNALAYTVGNNIVFGDKQYAPSSIEGQRLIAHELAHVAHQNHGSYPYRLERKEARDQQANVEVFDPVCDLRLLLGDPDKEKSLQVTEGQTQDLLIYLKKIRRNAPALETITLDVLEQYFPGFSRTIWDQSRKPFAGYVGARYGTSRPLVKAQELGLKPSHEKTWKRKFLGSDVLFFSGHHYARYGMPGYFDNLDVSKIRFVSPRVKLIFISSCAGLDESALSLWKKRFPNAYILGWKFASPLNQKGMVTRFIGRLSDELILESESDTEKIIVNWRNFIEEQSASPKKTVRPHGLGYATPQGDTHYYVEFQGKWQWTHKKSD